MIALLARHPAVSALLVLLGAGCDDEVREVRWVLSSSADVAALAASFDVSIREGSCTSPGAVVYDESYRVGEEPPLPPRLPPREHAYRAVIRDGLCRVVAEGCTVAGDAAEVEVVLGESSGDCPGACVMSVCSDDPRDSGVAVDAPESDGGTCSPLLAFDIAAGAAHSCAVQLGGALYCWGNDERGQLGRGDAGAESAVVPLRPSFGDEDRNISFVSLGAQHSCALDASDVLACWGHRDRYGLAPQGEDRRVPFDIPELRFRSFSAGFRHTCALDLDQTTVRCWGDNTAGQTAGNGAALGASLIAVTSGEFHSCALGSAGEIACWGANDRGQLGTNAPCDGRPDGCVLPPPQVFPPLAGDDAYVSVDAGRAHTCAITGNGRLVCAGANTVGQLGLGDAIDRQVPVEVPLPEGETAWIQVSAGNEHTCAITMSDEEGVGPLFCWGNDADGQLGLGNGGTQSEPARVGTGLWRAVSAGLGHTCGIDSGAEAACWGANGQGQLGVGDSEPRPFPTAVCLP